MSIKTFEPFTENITEAHKPAAKKIWRQLRDNVGTWYTNKDLAELAGMNTGPAIRTIIRYLRHLAANATVTQKKNLPYIAGSGKGYCMTYDLKVIEDHMTSQAQRLHEQQKSYEASAIVRDNILAQMNKLDQLSLIAQYEEE